MISRCHAALFAIAFVAVTGLVPGLAEAQDEPVAKTGFAAAVTAIDEGEWDVAYLLANADGPVARDLVTWIRLREGVGTYADYWNFLLRRSDWPDQQRLRDRAEEALTAEIPTLDVLTFFADRLPETGEGAVRLAAALTDAGRVDQAELVLVETWLNEGLSDTGFAVMMANHAETLAPYHAARVDAQLWRWRTDDAERLLEDLTEGERLLATARIALIRNSAGAAEALAAVPPEFANHPGLAYDRYNRFAVRGDYTEATEILMAQTGDAQSLGEPFRWASWRASLARWHMREGRGDLAYDLAHRHHLTEGRFFTDLEWLSGYLALRYQNDPVRALEHFTRLGEAVDTPISLARAGYWIGQAHLALGNADSAATALSGAAEHQTAFYGLLASDLIGRPLDPALAAAPDGDADPSVLEADLVVALSLLLDAGQRSYAVRFAAELGQTLDAAALTAVGQMLLDRDETFYALLLGKAAAARGIILPHIYFPVHPLADETWPVEDALALSIARRESEFRADAGSPVGALGLMQLMPATAEEVAGELAIGYSRSRLTSDWMYNARLGTRYLANLEERFGPSPVMIAAGYNAGPSRPATWMTERGDPRKGEVDVVDWIEHIPFTETRNYVMRVTESMPVYRARLTGEVPQGRFTDLLNGKPPFIRPVARPTPEERAAAAAAAQAAVAEAEAAAAREAEVASSGSPEPPPSPVAPPGIRPIARPGG